MNRQSNSLNQNERENNYVRQMIANLQSEKKLNRLQTEKLAMTFDITDRTDVKELTELSIVETARTIAQSELSNEEKYNQIVELYKRQTNLSFRTSQSIILAQYSTPAPIGFLMGLYCGIQNNTKSVFEPSAGNGLLTIATDPQNVIVNEIDKRRNANLQKQKYSAVLRKDASKPFPEFEKRFDAVITNPPFGSIGKMRLIDEYKIYNLDHLMTIIALQTMKDNGKSAIIIGGHTEFDERGRVILGKHRYFLNYLYHFYNVEDIIPIDGHKLYAKQGTAFNVRLILINGRKSNPSGATPLKTPESAIVVDTFEQLYQRVMKHNQTFSPEYIALIRQKMAEVKRLKQERNGKTIS